VGVFSGVYLYYLQCRSDNGMEVAAGIVFTKGILSSRRKRLKTCARNPTFYVYIWERASSPWRGSDLSQDVKCRKIQFQFFYFHSRIWFISSMSHAI